MICDFKGVILQPISSSIEPWAQYDRKHDGFLTYFQHTFKNEIETEFYVNHNTEGFSDYLLIPYFTDNKKCFGAYFINYGSEIENDYYSWAYHIDYTKSFNFIKEIYNYEIIDEAEFNNEIFEKVANDSRVFYYKIDKPSNDFQNYIISFFDKKAID